MGEQRKIGSSNAKEMSVFKKAAVLNPQIPRIVFFFAFDVQFALNSDSMAL